MKRFLHWFVLGLLLNGPFALKAQVIVHSTSPLPEAPRPQAGYRISDGHNFPVPVESSTSSSETQTTVGQAATPQQGASKSSADQIKAEEKQRMLGIVPEFNTVNGGEALPLTKGQKFHLWWKSSIDPFTFAVAGLDAGIEQAEDSYPGYQQGAEGFGKRYGAAYADAVDGNFWGNAVLPVLLRQDPRYFRLGHGSFKGRLWYAAISTVRTKGDNGKWQPNYSNVGGNLIGGAISNIYYPASDRGVSLIFERGLTVTAEGALGALAYEFYPDAIAYLKQRHHRHDVTSATPTTSAPAATP